MHLMTSVPLCHELLQLRSVLEHVVGLAVVVMMAAIPCQPEARHGSRSNRAWTLRKPGSFEGNDISTGALGWFILWGKDYFQDWEDEPR